MPELANILIGIEQFYVLMLKFYQVPVDIMTRIDAFFYLK